ncbi:hypothetical protein CBS101457_004822 [Exobasidium rhododendri]|nr:hypothetical protein CBS101457_004822 [Exobasidium rhododendri]
MKRSYPYTGPGASPSAPAPATPLAQPDYSAYGYGSNSALVANKASSNVGLSQEAQQAQWHQQWQQYYAQQAASGGTQGQPPQGRPLAAPPPQSQQQIPAQQVQHFGFQHPQPQQQPQYYGQQFAPQQPQVQQQMGSPYAWNQQQPQPQPALPAYQHVPQPFAAPNQSNYHNVNVIQGNQGPAKRPRVDIKQQRPIAGRPMMVPGNGQMSGYQPTQSGHVPQGFPNAPSGPSSHAMFGANQTWQTGPMRGGGGGGGPMNSQHMGGPSNMAGPMAALPTAMRAPSTPMADRKGPNQRPNRPHGIPSRSSLPSMNSTAKFNGPVGVNALHTQGNKSGFGGRSAGPSVGTGGAAGLGPRRIATGPRNGIPSGPSGKGNRFDQNKGKAATTTSSNKGLPVKAAGGFELAKAPVLNARTSTLADQPVPSSSRRTFSDFKIKGIKIDPIDWQWQQGEGEGDSEEGGEEEDSTTGMNESNLPDGATQVHKKARTTKRKDKGDSGKETCRLRICFAANPPPLGAPTGPKALSKSTDKEVRQSAQAYAPPSTQTEESGPSEWSAFSRGPPQSSTNRISISFASSKRRLVIDSEVIKLVELNRAEGTLKIVVNVTTAAGIKRKDQLEKKKGEEWLVVRGVLLEGREAEMENFGAISRRALEKSWREKGEATSEMMEDVKVEKQDEEPREGEEEEEDQKVASSAYLEAVEVKKEGEDEGQEEVMAAVARDGGEGDDDIDEEGDDVDDDDDADADERIEIEAQDEEAEKSDEATVGAEEGTEKREDEQTADEVFWYEHSSLPPFYRFLAHHEGPGEDAHHAAEGSPEMTITIFLAEQNPKQELKWVKTGDVEEWLSALPGFQSSLSSHSSTVNAANAVNAWTDKIRVVDPDPPPTVEEVLADWSQKSSLGTLIERKQFLKKQGLQLSDGVLNMICKLIRGDRANAPSPTTRDLGEPLKQVMENATLAHQNHLTLSVGAIFLMMKEFADSAGVDEEVVKGRMQKILLCLPTHLIFRACDGLFKEALEKERLSRPKVMATSGGAGGAGGAAATKASKRAGTASRDGSVRLGSVASTAADGQERVIVASEQEKQADEEEEEEEEVKVDSKAITSEVSAEGLSEDVVGREGEKEKEIKSEVEEKEIKSEVQEKEEVEEEDLEGEGEEAKEEDEESEEGK